MWEKLLLTIVKAQWMTGGGGRCEVEDIIGFLLLHSHHRYGREKNAGIINVKCYGCGFAKIITTSGKVKNCFDNIFLLLNIFYRPKRCFFKFKTLICFTKFWF